MKTFLLVVMLGNQHVDTYTTKTCDIDIRILSESMPEHDLYCIEPSYSMRPVARPVVE